MKVVFFGDVVSKAGRRAIHKYLPQVKAKHNPDFIIANGENASGGIGLTPDVAEELYIMGVDVITSGNHIWKYKELYPYLDSKAEKIIRPMNYPNSDQFSVPGMGYTLVKRDEIEFLVVNIMGRTFVQAIDCPFRAMDNLLSKYPLTKNRMIFVDFHAETTSEKEAMGWYLDGRVTAMFGTHTHVQTSDERILNKGTAYITDAGMCGPMDTVIGVDRDIIIQRFITQLPVAFKFSDESNLGVHGVCVEADPMTGKSVKIERILYRDNL